MAETHWRSVVKDAKEEKVFEGLEDPAWEWRTVGALAALSGLSEDDVRVVLANYPYLVQKAVRASGKEDLYTLKHRYFNRQRGSTPFSRTVELRY